MGALTALYYRDGHPIAPRVFERMQAMLEHRGPDGSGEWLGENVALGQQRRWSTPESRFEHLPLTVRSCTIVADVRLDNRAELIDRLDLGLRTAAQIGDGELILAAYERWGETCPGKLLGDFAFVIWDGNRQRMFCARDQMGVKPLYYHVSPKLFVAATEIKAIRVVPQVPTTINEVRLADHLVGIRDNPTTTFFEAIVRLPPAHLMIVGDDAVEIRQYWTLDATQELRLGSDAAYAEAFRETFSLAVRDRLRSAFPVGSMLSGGLDSSSIASSAAMMLAERGGEPLHTFSAVWPSLSEIAPKSDERRYAEAVVARGGIVPHWVHADADGPLADLERIIWHQDEIHLGFNLYMDWSIYKAASDAGVRVLMSGHDGDTTISYGYERFAELGRRGNALRLWRTAREVNQVNPKLAPTMLMWQFGVLPNIPMGTRQLWRKLRGSKAPTELQTPLNHSFRQRVGLDERLRAQQENYAGLIITTRREHGAALHDELLIHGLETFDKIGGAFGVEPRYPFCDRRVAEVCLAMPFAQRLYRGWSRSVLRRGMDGILPPEVQWRKGKSDISAHFSLGLGGIHRERIETMLGPQSERIASYFDVIQLRQAYERYRGAPLDHNDEALVLFQAAITDQWLRSLAEPVGDAVPTV